MVDAPHWLIPFAGALSPAAAEAAAGLSLPHLERLLARLAPVARDAGSEHSLSTPHERALARARGWLPARPLTPDDTPDHTRDAPADVPALDGLLPMAAEQARADGLAVPDGSAWGLLTPAHWHLGTEQVSLADPEALQLSPGASRALFDAVAPLFRDDGIAMHHASPLRWYVQHPSLATLPTAALDRVVGRNVDIWLTPHPEARRWRRLQAEVQMLLHTHPLNAQREADGQLPVNSFWLSGTGATRPPAHTPGLRLDARLRAPALAEDWAAWAEAWAALDAGPLAEALALAEAGAPLALTLCGERTAQRFEPQPRGLLRRWLGPRRVAAAPLLQGL